MNRTDAVAEMEFGFSGDALATTGTQTINDMHQGPLAASIDLSFCGTDRPFATQVQRLERPASPAG